MAYQLELFPKEQTFWRITADELKVAIMKKYVFEKHYELAASEVHYCDIVITNIDANPILEVETKISYNDFLADFDKEKHEKYLNLEGMVPDYFFFGIPDYLEKQVLEFLANSKYDYYGVIVVNSVGFVTTAKRAKRFPTSSANRRQFKEYLLKRETRQLINFYDEKNLQNYSSGISLI